MLFCSKTADLFGRKLQLLTGLLLLSLFSLLTAFSPNPLFMNVLCGFLGLGTAIIAPPAIGTLFATYPEGTRRNRVAGAMGAANPLGFIFGSVSSGLATKYASWRQSFMVIAVFFFVLAGMAVWTMPAIPRAGNAGKQLKEFDYLGTLLVIAGMACVSAALTYVFLSPWLKPLSELIFIDSEAPQLGWHSYKVLLLLFIGLASLSLFALWEHHVPCPLLPSHIFSNSTFTLSITCVALGYMSFITNQFWISLYMQDIQQLAPLHIAVRLMPQALLGIIWSYLGEEVVSMISGRIIMAVGGLGYIGGAVLVLFIKPETSYWALLFPALCITVIGADFQFIVSNVGIRFLPAYFCSRRKIDAAQLYITSALPPSQSSLGAGILQTALRLSISVGLAITSAVYGATAQTPQGRSYPTFAFSRVFLCTIIFASLSLVIIPFLQIGRQGKTPLDVEELFEMNSCSVHRSDSQSSLWSSVSSRHFGGRWGGGGGSEGWGYGEESWKWVEVDRFEVCLRCGEERKVYQHVHTVSGIR